MGYISPTLWGIGLEAFCSQAGYPALQGSVPSLKGLGCLSHSTQHSAGGSVLG